MYVGMSSFKNLPKSTFSHELFPFFEMYIPELRIIENFQSFLGKFHPM